MSTPFPHLLHGFATMVKQPSDSSSRSHKEMTDVHEQNCVVHIALEKKLKIQMGKRITVALAINSSLLFCAAMSAVK